QKIIWFSRLFGLSAEYFLFVRHHLLWNIFDLEISWCHSGNVKRQIFLQVGEILSARDKIGFTFYFYQYANLAAGMNVAVNASFLSLFAFALGSRNDSLFAQKIYRLVEIAFSFTQGAFAIGKASASFLTQGLNLIGGNSHNLTHL